MPRSLHVQCTFNVRSLSAHCERMVPVVKSMRSVKEGVGSVTGCILNSAFAALSLQLLQREHFAQGTSRKSISFCFRPAGHIHIQHTHVCEERRGKRNRLYFEFRLCSFVFATFAERALCSGYVSEKHFFLFSARRPHSHPTHPLTARDHASRICAKG